MAAFAKNKDSNESDDGDLRSMRAENERLKERISYLSQVMEAMWTLLQDRQEITDARLLDEVKALKERGEPAPDSCPMCDRPLSLRTNACNYCGTRVEKSRVF